MKGVGTLRVLTVKANGRTWQQHYFFLCLFHRSTTSTFARASQQILRSCLPFCCQIVVTRSTEPACFCSYREKSWGITFWSSSSQLFKHNKMYINSSSRQIRRNKATYGGVVYGPRKNKSCSKCVDTFPIVLQLLPHDVPGFHSAASGGVASVLWCVVGPPSPLWAVLVWLVLY